MKRFPFLAVAGLIARAAAGQASNLIDIETDNGVFYAYDTADSTKFATLPGVIGPWSATPGVASRNFWSGVFIADIVLVNGRPAHGVMVRRGTRISLAASAGSGQAIADAAGNFIDDGVWVFQREDGTTFGTITTHGLIGGGPSQGAPALATEHQSRGHRRDRGLLRSTRPNDRDAAGERQRGASHTGFDYRGSGEPPHEWRKQIPLPSATDTGRTAGDRAHGRRTGSRART